MENALRILSCSWPRPLQASDRRWVSEPEWDAPAMPALPHWTHHRIDGTSTPAINWRDLFARDLPVHSQHRAGEMKEFHIVFRLRVERAGTLVFHDDDGCIIRRNGEVLHEDREAHSLQRHEIVVAAGDRLEIAHWQLDGEWLWAGRVQPSIATLDDDVALFAPYRAAVEKALRKPSGPPLKTYFAATHPIRAALAIYSLVLNGYRPEKVLIYGDEQWDDDRRRRVEALLPFAEIVPNAAVFESIDALHPEVAVVARSCWAAMKIAVGLLQAPFEYCFLDDDVFVLDRMDDAVARFADHDLVYAPDCDHGESYRRLWRHDDSLPTGNVNTGIIFVRNQRDRAAQAERLVRNPPHPHPAWLWEQGFVATEFAVAPTFALPTQRYFYPIFDGLPGGIAGYDWAANPCGFATVHFGGLQHKPSDDECRSLVHDILGRRRAAKGGSSWSVPPSPSRSTRSRRASAPRSKRSPATLPPPITS